MNDRDKQQLKKLISKHNRKVDSLNWQSISYQEKANATFQAELETFLTAKLNEARIEAQQRLIASAQRVTQGNLPQYLDDKEYDLNQEMIELQGGKES